MYIFPANLTLFQGIADWDLKETLDKLPLRQFPKGFMLYDETEMSGEIFAVRRKSKMKNFLCIRQGMPVFA